MPRRLFPFVAVGLVAAVVAVPRTAAEAPRQQGNAEKQFVDEVNAAIKKGRDYLVREEKAKGNWEGVVLQALGNQVGGQTALATLALLNTGMTSKDPVVARALDYLRGLPRDKTYVVGLTTMVFAEAREAKDLQRIKENADWLIKVAEKRGGRIIGWSYPLEANSGRPDGSNTQYALLGLYAAKQAGVKIDDDTWAQLRELYTTSQQKDEEKPDRGSWRYDVVAGGRFGNAASFSMSVAGVCGLLIAGMGLNESQQQLDEKTGVAAKCGQYATTDPVAKGMNWIAGHFAFQNAKNAKSTYYNVYGLERLGRLSGQRFIGSHDWYREGCKFLVGRQNDDGSWRGNETADTLSTVATSFALLFLSKGRTPILMTKFAYGDARINPDTGLLVERGGDDNRGIVGWNRKQNDVRHLTEYASRELFNGLPLGWQVYDARRVGLAPARMKEEVEQLLACPIVYFNGHEKPILSGEQKQLLKTYIDEGGFLVAEACCGSPEFAAGFRELMKELFPDNQLQPMPAEHPIWRAYFQVPPADFKGLEVLDRGCKTVVVFSPVPLAGFWEENRFMVGKGTPAANRGQKAYQLAGNVIAYATGMQPPEQKGTKVRVADAKADLSPPRGAFKPAQLKLPGETPPAPAAMRNLMAFVKDVTALDAVLDKKAIGPGDAELLKYKFMYLHGRKRFELTDAEIDNLRMNLETGGLLLADAACGKREFDDSFRELVKKMYPDAKLEPIPLDDPLYSADTNGIAIRTVKRREKADGAGPDGGFKELPPALEGIKLDGRWAVVYSKYDIGCALERHKSTDCLGHTPDSALALATAAVLYSLKK